MDLRPSSFPQTFLVAGLVCAGTALGAPTIEEVLSTGPKSVVGPLANLEPTHDFTPWHLAYFSSEEGKMSVTFKAEANIWTLPSDGADYLVSEGYFVRWANNYGPTEKFVESTRPDPVEGGTWVFGYAYRDASYWSGDAHHVASWTWRQDSPSNPTVSPEARRGVAFSIALNRSVVRSLRGKGTRRARALLDRQQNILKALSEAN